MDRRCVHALMAAAAFGLCLSTSAAAADRRPWSEMSQAEAERVVDDSLRANGDAVGAWVRTQLPKDYPGMLRRMTAMLRAGLEDNDFYWPSRLDLQRIYTAHKSDLSAAPAADVMALARAEATYVSTLQANGPAACAEYMGGFNWIGAPGGDDRAETALQAADRARIGAIRAGMDRPQTRGAPAASDTAAWAEALASHEGRKLAAQYVDDGWFRKAGQRDLCTALVAFFDAFLALPPESGARIFLSFDANWRKLPSEAAEKAEVGGEAEARRVVEGWASEPGPQNLDAELKANLPADYRRYVDRMTPLVLAEIDEREVNRLKNDFLLELPMAHLDDIKAAPDDALQAWARVESAYRHAVQADGPGACVSSISHVQVDPEGAKGSDASDAAFFDAFKARWRLIRAGIDRPALREDASPADRSAWRASVVKRLGEKQTADLPDEAWRKSAPHRTLCAADVGAFDALLDTAPANAAPLMALTAAGFNILRVDPFLGASQANAEKAVDAAVETLPRAGFVQALKANLADDYRAYRRELAELLRKGGKAKDVQAKTE